MIYPPQPQSSPSKIYDDHDLNSEVWLLYLFQRARAELFKTESSSTIRLPPILSPQPLTPDAKWHRLRAAAAMSREHAQALASSPIVSSMSQPQSSPLKICIDHDLDSSLSMVAAIQPKSKALELPKHGMR